ncbi:MAG: aminoacyl-tRNA hydrolase [Gemmatimonadales bacterium]|nr:aminoacyl-tRNA hydrolase [Gemmatimonadales bacterium]
MRTVLGLGNPGAEYEGTRHNAGFLLLDHLARRWHLPAFGRGERSRSCEGRVHGRGVRLVKPQTYMNRSGAALAPLLVPGFDPASDLLLVVDDVAIPTGAFRFRGAGSSGGHNGLKSIEATLRRQDYPRLRIGVGPKPVGADLSDFVLAPFSREERELVEAQFDAMADGVECWLDEGIERAMNRFNRGREP